MLHSTSLVLVPRRLQPNRGQMPQGTMTGKCGDVAVLSSPRHALEGDYGSLVFYSSLPYLSTSLYFS
jgi:hypothetical protein